MVIDTVTNLHILLNGKWYQDKRIVYLSMALGLYENTLQTIPNFTRIDHLRQGMEVFSNENPTHERAALIRSIAKDILPKKNPNEVKRKRTKLGITVDKMVPASQRPTQTGCKETQKLWQRNIQEKLRL